MVAPRVGNAQQCAHHAQQAQRVRISEGVSNIGEQVWLGRSVLPGPGGLARLEHHPRAVGDLHAGALQRLDRDEVGHVDTERLACEPALSKLERDPLTEPVGDARLDRHRAAHRSDARAEVLRREPGGEELVMARRGAEVPEDRVVATREQRETGVLVARPLADVRARDVADVVRVEQEQPAEVGGVERLLCPRQAIAAELREVDPLLPVHRARRVGRADRPASHRHRNTS